MAFTAACCLLSYIVQRMQQYVTYCSEKCVNECRHYTGALVVHKRSFVPGYCEARETLSNMGWVGIRLALHDAAAQGAQFTTERQPVLRPAVAFSKTSFKHR